jgi:DHA2 family methylenomycin A resistance protein-like MFS transporter
MVMATLLMVGFVVAERRHAQPLLPLGFFRSRTFSGATAVGFLLNLTLYGLLFVLGLYFQQTKHWSAWVSGIAFLPLPVVLGLANILARRAGAWLRADRDDGWAGGRCLRHGVLGGDRTGNVLS